MAYLLLGGLALLALLGLGRAFAGADPRSLIRAARYAVGWGLIVFAAILLLARRFGLAGAAAAIGIAVLRTGRIGPFDLNAPSRGAGTASTVRAAFVEMRLDHDSGTLEGRVVRGRFAGRALESLDDAALRTLHAEVAADPDSLSLVEAYLDRRLPGWREDFQADEAGGPAGPARPGAMTEEEAYQVLGLPPGADEAEIRAAHRRLMKGVHPDQGGSTFLAAKLNEAKDRLLGKHS